MTKPIIRVALPSSILSVEHSLLMKSIRIHQVARWTSIFNVVEVVFYKEPSTLINEFKKHVELIEDHWKYFFTPPYLRKRLVPLKPSLKHVGSLPPIRLNIFNVDKKPRKNEKRLGYVYRGRDGALLALIGDTVPYRVIDGDCEKKQDLALLLVVDVDEYAVKCIDEPVYRGPLLKFKSSLREVVDEYRKVSVIIATDRKGEYVKSDIVNKLRGSDLLLLFGSPKYDLFEISNQEGFRIEDYVDYVWNTVPGQQVVTVRTEEALIITLGVLNTFLRV